MPFAGKYKEIFNSDVVEFGGEGVVNSRVKTAKAEECDEREYSIKVKLPALGVSIYSCTPGKAPARKKVTAAKTAKDKTAKDKTAGKLVRTVKAKTPAKKSVKEEKATKVEEAVIFYCGSFLHCFCLFLCLDSFFCFRSFFFLY